MHNESPLSLKNVLYSEHLLLGAKFSNGVVATYPHEPSVQTLRSDMATAFLCDTSGAQTLVFSGEDASSFASAAFAGTKLQVGECAFEVAFTGDGGVASIPLLCRTGTHEYVCLDRSSRSEVLSAWLTFLANISQDGYTPYARMTTTDASSAHVVLTLGGHAARHVLRDYLEERFIPQAGQVCACELDGHIHAIVACTLVDNLECFTLFVAPHEASTLWRSLLSFKEVVPIGLSTIAELFTEATNWYAYLDTTDALRLDVALLAREGLVRNTNDFVGARALGTGRGE